MALEGIVSDQVFVLVENLVALRDVLVQVLEHEECGFLLSFLKDRRGDFFSLLIHELLLLVLALAKNVAEEVFVFLLLVLALEGSESEEGVDEAALGVEQELFGLVEVLEEVVEVAASEEKVEGGLEVEVLGVIHGGQGVDFVDELSVDEVSELGEGGSELRKLVFLSRNCFLLLPAQKVLVLVEVVADFCLHLV